MTVNLDNAQVFLLVMLRITGLLVTNPILGRRGVPARVHAGFALILTVILTTSLNFTVPVQSPSFVTFVSMAIKELAVGMIASFILLMFLSVLTVGGEIIDMQMGIGMAKVFDPGTNSSISVSATFFNAMFVLIFFATNNHLTLIRMAAQTFTMVPLGAYSFNWNMAGYLPDLFSTILVFAFKLCMPMIVLEIIVTAAVGIMMRVVPQINVFVVNIQFKLIIGIFSLLVLVVPFMNYFEMLITQCFEQIGLVWRTLAA